MSIFKWIPGLNQNLKDFFTASLSPGGTSVFLSVQEETLSGTKKLQDSYFPLREQGQGKLVLPT